MQKIIFALLSLLLLSACKRNDFVLSTQHKYDKIDSTTVENTAMRDSISLYKKKVDAEMSTVIAYSPEALTKKQPESTLGNYIADAVHAQAEKYGKISADLTVLNHGGLRIDALPKGDWTRGNIFELLPFDNMVVIVEMKGTAVNQLLQHIAAKEGWPVSRHLRMEIKAGKAQNGKISGATIDENKTYRVVTNDYLANGGDNCTFFVGCPQRETGKFIRDAVIEYLEAQNKEKQAIKAEIEGRIRRLD
jgi:2',3'-cyclic-nucleotide 2'-phosphodiesterase (5'-nucleotidase family)